MMIQYFYNETLVSGISTSDKFLYDDLDAPFVWNALESFMEDPSHPNDPARPKAYLNWVLLDDQRLQPVAGAFGKIQVPEITGVEEKKLLQLAGGDYIDIPVNGFLYVFISNESKGNVYFDDLRIEHIQGPLLEETHYYPFGLAMAGISSKAAGSLKNRNLYNSKELQNKEFSDGSGLETYDYLARMQDPQIGRFWQIDPSVDSYPSWTPYNYVGNNPILITDPDGKDWVVSIEEDKKGNKIYNITVNGILYNNSSNSSLDMAKLQASIEKQVGDVYNFSGEGFSVKMNFNLRTVTSLDDVKETDHVFQVVDQKYISKGAVAEAELNGLNIKIGADMVNNIIDNKNTRTVAHELGHTAGWNHPHDSKGKADPKTAWEAMRPDQMRKNLMSQTWFVQTQNGTNAQNISTDITFNQMVLLRSNSTTGNLNKNSPLYNKLGVSFVRLTPFTLPVPIITREKALRR